MPSVVRLAADVPEDELRLYWDETDEGRCLHAWGHRSDSRIILDLIVGKRLAIRDGVGFGAQVSLRQSMLDQAPSVADVLEEMGYDKTTLVVSIRRKGVPVPPAEVPDDVRARLEDATMALKALARALEDRGETRGVYVYDDGEMDAVMSALEEARFSVSHAAALVNGTESPQEDGTG